MLHTAHVGNISVKPVKEIFGQKSKCFEVYKPTEKVKKASTSIFLANRCFIKTKYNMYIHDRTGKRSTYQPRPFFLSTIFY